MGPATYGEFSIVFTGALAAAALFFGWLSQGVARFANGRDDLLGGCPEAFFFGWGVSAALILAVALFCSLFWSPGSVLILAALAACAQGMHLLVISMHQARFRISQYLGLEAFRAVCIAASVILAALSWAHDYIGLVAALAVGMVLDMLIVCMSARRYVTFGLAKASAMSDRLRPVLGYSWPIAIWLASSLAIPFSDRFVLSRIASSDAMGSYAYQYDIVFRAFTFILLPVTLMVQPAIFKAYADDQHRLVNSLIRKGVLIQGAFGTLFIGVLYGLIFQILPIFNINLHLSVGVFLFLSVGACCWQIALMCQKLLECKKRISTMVGILFFAYLCCGLLPSIVLYRTFGISGFAAGSLLSGSVYCIVALSLGRMAEKEKLTNNSQIGV